MRKTGIEDVANILDGTGRKEWVFLLLVFLGSSRELSSKRESEVSRGDPGSSGEGRWGKTVERGVRGSSTWS